jgi:hypothetical protein
MKVDGTELEYDESYGVCLDFYLGEYSETKEQWAKRVWDNCKLYKENDGKDLSGNPLPKVYARDAEELWEEKKRRRRAAFVNHCTGKYCDKELLSPERIKQDLKEGKPCDWGLSHRREEILNLKNDPKHNYKTATQSYREKEAEYLEESNRIKDKIAEKVAILRTKFDDETIAIIFPEGAGLL